MSSNSESDFDVNSMDRYTKRSEKLSLQQPCEIPAGCGGVVFRWIDPSDGVPLRFNVAVDGEATIYVNGEQVERGRVRAMPGDMMLCVRVDSEAKRQVDWFKLQCEASIVDSSVEERARFDTADDGQWLATTKRPGDDWLTFDYPDSDWQPITHCETPDSILESLDRGIRWRFSRLPNTASLGLPSSSSVWIRRRLTLEI